jgi:hypothetical protein
LSTATAIQRRDQRCAGSTIAWGKVLWRRQANRYLQALPVTRFRP